jgi:putative hydrolase
VRSGQLSKVEGLGPKRKQTIKDWLSKHPGERNRQLSWTHAADHQADIKTVLEVDAVHRSKAAAGKLPQIAPRQFNPENKAWLPILHGTYKQWHFTALYSNTERAHQLKRTQDWVVIYFYDDHHQESQNTVVTETHGQLRGKRVVRGREAECLDYYDAKKPESKASTSEHQEVAIRLSRPVTLIYHQFSSIAIIAPANARNESFCASHSSPCVPR